MLEQLKYQNHLNEVFEFGKDGIFVHANDLHDYEWTVMQNGSKIGSLSHGISSRTLPIVIVCKTEAEGIAARNRLHEVVEKDVLAMQHGKIIIGDFYFRCFVTASTKSHYLTSKRLMEVSLTLTTDYPMWVKESTFVFRKMNDATGKDFDYPADFPLDYSSGIGRATLNNTAFAGSNFKMIIYGACIDPTVFIDGHAYTVICEVAANEYLTIDSLTKKIFITHNDGSTTNVFHCRNRESYIFEKIPAGKNVISWSGEFGVDITIFEERSEPRWI